MLGLLFIRMTWCWVVASGGLVGRWIHDVEVRKGWYKGVYMGRLEGGICHWLARKKLQVFLTLNPFSNPVFSQILPLLLLLLSPYCYYSRYLYGSYLWWFVRCWSTQTTFYGECDEVESVITYVVFSLRLGRVYKIVKYIDIAINDLLCMEGVGSLGWQGDRYNIFNLPFH